MSDRSRNSLHEPLAIVGMACRLPGAENVDAFWQLLQAGGSAIGPLPAAKLDRGLYFHDEKGRRGKTYSDRGGLIQEREIDWSLMPLSPSEARAWDPAHLILCEVTAAACRDAGYDPSNLPQQRTGVYVGHSGGSTLGGDLAYRALAQDYVGILDRVDDWRAQPKEFKQALAKRLLGRLQAERPQRDEHGLPLVDAGYAAGLISQALKLTGPHIVIDAACASSLFALVLGAAALNSGQVDMALVAGASFNKCDSLILFSQAQSCSAKASKPFDAEADGLISSEGYVTLVLKRLDAAEAAGDRIHAIIRGIGASSDGRGRSLWAPRKEGQLAAIRRAYSEDVRPDSIQLIEAHATSTQVGDATEMDALATYFKEQLPASQRIPVGSVKSNIGHTLETAGLAGLIKTVLAMQHGIIPPSINVSQLNDTIPWSEIPLFVPRACMPWPELSSGIARRAAVNAFGIGGLNVHVVVEQALARKTSMAGELELRSRSQAQSRRGTRNLPVAREPIAIIGRGLVLPGALSVDAFQRLLEHKIQHIHAPPANRWQGEPQIRVQRKGNAEAIPVAGGFVEGFEYDWRKHKIPPKQIAQANPLQFMLLEAAEQALREAGYIDRQSHRDATAVVVGSAFGGEFGNALYAGLRLPELRDRLVSLLESSGWTRLRAIKLADQYEIEFLKQAPALLDETGSFTSSTLASRLSKTFDLMGGAMAVDAGDASSLAALDAACLLLRSGSVSHVLCAAASRSMDRAAFECLALHQRLPRFRGNALGQCSDAPHDGYYPGEGVAVLLLKRLSDARRDGDNIISTIQDVAAGFDAQATATSIAIATKQLTSSTWLPQPSKAIGRLNFAQLDQAIADGLEASDVGCLLESSQSLSLIGHLQAAQGLVNIIEATLDRARLQSATLIANCTRSGLSYCALVQPAVAESTARVPSETRQPTLRNSNQPCIEQPHSQNWRIVRYSAAKLEQLRDVLSMASAWSANSQTDARVEQFSAVAGWRAALVCNINEDPAARLKTLASQIGNRASRVPLAEQGMFWANPETRCNRVAWLFPGQGSQYSGMFRELVNNHSAAAAALEQANAGLERIGQPPFEQLVWHDPESLGEDVWHTQLSILVADWMMACVLRNRGFEPDVVAGHSFGELPAMLAAGCWDIAAALQATWHRCQSIIRHGPVGCGMLSISANHEVVRRLLVGHAASISISHLNAPEQTVVGGKHAAIAQFAQLLDSEGIGSRLLAVPTAFHTPFLTAAQQPFAAALDSVALQPPSIPLLSSVTNRYVADPRDMRSGLAAQLTQPIDFIALVKQLENDGITLAIEVGPQQVLSRLVRQTASEQLQVVSTDNPKRGTEFQLSCAQAASEVYGAARQRLARANIALVLDNISARPNSKVAAHSVIAHPVMQFDATELRRTRMKSAASTGRMPGQGRGAAVAVERPLHFDATEIRKNIAPQACNELASIAPTEFASGTPSSPRLIETFLIDFVVEQTGYPAGIIELDWDIEADLGIDSIKKAQLFGELREFFDLEAHRDLTLDEFRTLRDIVCLLERTPRRGDWISHSPPEMEGQELARTNQAQAIAKQSDAKATPAAVPYMPADSAPSASSPFQTRPAPLEATHVAQQPSSRAKTASRTATEPNSLSASQVEQFLIDFVVEQTGYPPEIVDLDADLEADLGIDSIKKAQLMGELREMFSFGDSSPTGGRVLLSDYRTLRQILNMLVRNQGSIVEPRDQQASTRPSVDENRAQVASTHRPIASLAPNADQPTGQAEFAVDRSLKCDAELAEQSLPVMAWFDGSLKQELRSSPQFELALNANLVAMAGRRIDARQDCSRSSMTSRPIEIKPRWNAIAHNCKIDVHSLLALNQCLATQSTWLANGLSASRDSGHNGEVASLSWLLEFNVPPWLQQGGGCPIGIALCGDLSRPMVGFGVPGELNPATMLTHRGLLVSAGELASSGARSESGNPGLFSTTKLAIAERLVETVRRIETSAELIAEVERWRFEHDWWLQLAHLPDSRLTVIQCRRNTLEVQQLALESSRSSCGETWPAELAARIGYDAQRREMVLCTRLEGPLYSPMEMVLPLDDLGGCVADLLEQCTRGGHVGSLSPAEIETTRILDRSAVVTVRSDQEAEPRTLIRTENHSANVAGRYVLRLCPAPQPLVPGRMPIWSGAAMIVGYSPVARQLGARLTSAGVKVYSMPVSDDPLALSVALDQIWQQQPVTHLFLTSPCDAEARITLDERAWQARKRQGILGPYWLCQNWLRRIKDARLTDDSSLVAVSSLGGDFGLQGKLHSAEGGGLAGLLKSIFIESWVEGYRTLPIKVLDIRVGQSPAEVVDFLWRELAVPNFDIEVAYPNGIRHVIRAIAQPVPEQRETIRRSGNWVCTGGARGITAYVAEHLAQRYGLRLHLLGTQAPPAISSEWHTLDEEGLRQLRAQIMTQARGTGKNPIQTWQDTEKAIEIDATLRRLMEQGIEAHYHCCDISQRRTLHETVQRVREMSGPIEGVLHGAGVGKDARFDQKQPARVQQCIAAKVDGALALFEATQHDPLRYFLGFGSISGRFGANGHTDYSLANDMLCKQIDWLRSQRPEIAAVGIHWHAWGDVGMATKPETKLALEMIDMQFMPAVEGLEHLIRELECGAPEGEVLITDDRYYRLFYPAESMTTASHSTTLAEKVPTPLLEGVIPSAEPDWQCLRGILRPAKDPFLVEHRLDGSPLLPIVIGCELLMEAAHARLGRECAFELCDIEALQGLRCFNKEPFEIKVLTRELPDGNIECKLTSDFVSRDGRLVQANRVNLKALAVLATTEQLQGTRVEVPAHAVWRAVEYPQASDRFYVGSPLQKLRKIAIGDATLVGKISAPVLIELAGGARSVVGWRIPCAALDACLFATGILAWQQVTAGSALPVRFGRIRLGRLPSPGEACEVHVRFKSASSGRAVFDFTLYGVNGDTLVDARDYQVAWLASEATDNSLRRSHVHQ